MAPDQGDSAERGIEAYERDLLATERRLDQLLGSSASNDPTSASQALPASEARQANKVGADTGHEDDAELEEGASNEQRMTRESRHPCSEACQALDSMRRVSNKICELTSASSTRCMSARQRVKKASTRVADAGCSC